LDVVNCSDTQEALYGAIDRNRNLLNEDERIELEYFAVVNSGNFQSIKGGELPNETFVIVAAVVAGVRLIDNCRLGCS
jgi:pantothenate synthetase